MAPNPEENQYAYSPYCSLYISKGADKENLFNNQDWASSSGDYFFFLMTFMFASGVILYEEIRC